MGLVLITGVLVAWWAESGGNPLLTEIGVDPSPGNMEGKEVRFGRRDQRAIRCCDHRTSTAP